MLHKVSAHEESWESQLALYLVVGTTILGQQLTHSPRPQPAPPPSSGPLAFIRFNLLGCLLCSLRFYARKVMGVRQYSQPHTSVTLQREGRASDARGTYLQLRGLVHSTVSLLFSTALHSAYRQVIGLNTGSYV